MKIFRLNQTYRNIKRYRQIVAVFMKHGFGDIVERLKLELNIRLKKEIRKKVISEEVVYTNRPERMRRAFEELGGTFVKLGQMLSVRPDLVPQNFVKEFMKLQDTVKPFPFEKAMVQIESELDSKLDELFDYFDNVPLASASIAQVHKAITKDGDIVAVKVQRPNIHNVIETDINILLDLAKLLEKRIPESRLYNPVGIVNEFAKTIRQELDFVREARNMDKFKRNFEKDETIYVPNVYWDLTTSEVLTMEYIDGIKLKNLERIEKAGLDKKTIAINGAKAILKQVFEYGFFHADPHPGNIFVLENNVIVPIDYGMMGRLDDELQEMLGRILVGIIEQDADGIIKAFRKLNLIDDDINTRALKLDLIDFIDQYYPMPLSQLEIEKIMDQLFTTLSRHRINLPVDFTMMGRALAIEEGVGQMLYPDFDMISLAEPFIRELMFRRKFDIKRKIRDASKWYDEVSEFLESLPSDMSAVISKVKKGELNVKFEHKGLEELIHKLDKASNRLAFGMVVASLIVSSSLIIQSDKGPMLMGFPAIGVIGFLLAGTLGFWLIINILRSGRL